jgi:predicted acyl esterase
MPIARFSECVVRGELMRGEFRDSFANPTRFEPGKVTKVQYMMPDDHHAFRGGHRIMVPVQSCWFPLVDHAAVDAKSFHLDACDQHVEQFVVNGRIVAGVDRVGFEQQSDGIGGYGACAFSNQSDFDAGRQSVRRRG